MSNSDVEGFQSTLLQEALFTTKYLKDYILRTKNLCSRLTVESSSKKSPLLSSLIKTCFLLKNV